MKTQAGLRIEHFQPFSQANDLRGVQQCFVARSVAILGASRSQSERTLQVYRRNKTLLSCETRVWITKMLGECQCFATDLRSVLESTTGPRRRYWMELRWEKSIKLHQPPTSVLMSRTGWAFLFQFFFCYSYSYLFLLFGYWALIDVNWRHNFVWSLVEVGRMFLELLVNVLNALGFT